jgi:DNA-binding Lrp family transcriptional regulator
MKKVNPVDKLILKVIQDDMKNNGYEISYLNNAEISKITGLSIYRVRDSIVKMNKLNILNNLTNYWDPNLKFHNRIIMPGRESLKLN